VIYPPGTDCANGCSHWISKLTPRIALEAGYAALRQIGLAGHGLAILPRPVADEGLPVGAHCQ
jgi:DNA-binding transcriptional LysR family regulator